MRIGAQLQQERAGVLADGTKIDGPVALRKALLAHPDDFAETVASKLLTYALGRGVEYYDQPAIRKIVRGARPASERWSSIILEIVNSVPFQMRAPAVSPYTKEGSAGREGLP